MASSQKPVARSQWPALKPVADYPWPVARIPLPRRAPTAAPPPGPSGPGPAPGSPHAPLRAPPWPHAGLRGGGPGVGRGGAWQMARPLLRITDSESIFYNFEILEFGILDFYMEVFCEFWGFNLLRFRS